MQRNTTNQHHNKQRNRSLFRKHTDKERMPQKPQKRNGSCHKKITGEERVVPQKKKKNQHERGTGRATEKKSTRERNGSCQSKKVNRVKVKQLLKLALTSSDPKTKLGNRGQVKQRRAGFKRRIFVCFAVHIKHRDELTPNHILLCGDVVHCEGTSNQSTSMNGK